MNIFVCLRIFLASQMLKEYNFTVMNVEYRMKKASVAQIETLKIRGKLLADEVKESVIKEVEKVAIQGVNVRMAAILASEDEASKSYALAKQRTASSLGIHMDIHDLGAKASQKRVNELCESLSQDKNIHGVLLELPLAPHLNGEEALTHIMPSKDIDGMTVENMGLLSIGRENEALISATAQACVMLAETQGSLEGKKVTVIGRGKTVGRPLALMLLNRHATVLICHSRTSNLTSSVSDSDVVFVAIGKSHAVTNEHLHKGQIIIDAGINFKEGKLVGDVDIHSVEGLVSAITPVPGGVGPLTSVLIFQNLLRALRLQNAIV